MVLGLVDNSNGVRSMTVEDEKNEDEPFVHLGNENPTGEMITLDRVIHECGALSRYQCLHFIFLTLLPIASGVFNFYYVYAAAEPQHNCHVSGSNSGFPPEKCLYMPNDGENQLITTTRACTSWMYDRSIYGKTITEEADLVCEHSYRRSFLNASLQMGAMLIFFTGQMNDFLGRRRSIHLLVGLLLTTSLITQLLMQFAPISIQQKFGLLLINQFISGIDAFVPSFLLLMELTTASHAAFAGNLALLGYAVGQAVVTGMAYVCRDWLLLKWVMTLYILAIVPYLFFIPESPHWLLTKRRYEDLEQLLRQMAHWNRRSESKWFPLYRRLLEQHHTKLNDVNVKTKVKLSFVARAKRLLTHRLTMQNLLISGFLGFVTLLLYFKIAYGLGAMDEINPYVNILIGAAVEGFGYISASAIMARFGRKTVLILFLIPTVICLLATPISLRQGRLITALVAQLGKFTISGAVCVTYIFVPELFPTSIRGTGMGFFVLLSRFGATVAPIIDASISDNHSFVNAMYYIYAFLTIVCVLLTLILPETRNVPLTDQIDYSSNKRKKSSTNRMSAQI